MSALRKPRLACRRWGSKYAREIALVLLVKLLLIVAIKLVFFNNPVPKGEIVERIDAAFGSQSSAPATRVSPDSSRKNS